MDPVPLFWLLIGLAPQETASLVHSSVACPSHALPCAPPALRTPAICWPAVAWHSPPSSVNFSLHPLPCLSHHLFPFRPLLSSGGVYDDGAIFIWFNSFCLNVQQPFQSVHVCLGCHPCSAAAPNRPPPPPHKYMRVSPHDSKTTSGTYTLKATRGY